MYSTWTDKTLCRLSRYSKETTGLIEPPIILVRLKPVFHISLNRTIGASSTSHCISVIRENCTAALLANPDNKFFTISLQFSILFVYFPTFAFFFPVQRGFL